MGKSLQREQDQKGFKSRAIFYFYCILRNIQAKKTKASALIIMSQKNICFLRHRQEHFSCPPRKAIKHSGQPRFHARS